MVSLTVPLASMMRVVPLGGEDVRFLFFCHVDMIDI